MSLAHLPAAMLAALTALGAELDAWATAHPDRPLAEAEAAVLATVRSQLPALLHAVLQQSQRAWSQQPVRCPRCRHAARVRDWRRRTVLTVCGRLCWERAWAACNQCQQGFGAGEAALEPGPYQQRSAGLDALVIALGSVTAFREAASLLTETTGLVLSAETIRGMTEAAGAALVVAEDTAAAQGAATGEPAGPLAAAPGRLVTETDGVMVRYRDGWHELKLALVGGWDREQRLLAVSYLARRAEATVFGRLWGAEAARRGALTVVGWQGAGQSIAKLCPIVVLGDGAHWIWETAAEQFGERTEIGDYYHACEHLTAVAEALHGAQTPAAQAWAAAQRGVLLREGVAVVLTAMHSPGGLSEAAQTALRRERGYFTSNQARMRYPTLRERGLPIGSGAIESSAKHLIQLRLKRPGCRWSAAGGEALAALRAQRATCLGQAA